MGRGIIKIDLLTIKDALMLPEAYKTVSVHCNYREDQISLIIDHPDIPEVEGSQPFPLVTLIYECERQSRFKEMRIEHKAPTEPVEQQWRDSVSGGAAVATRRWSEEDNAEK